MMPVGCQYPISIWESGEWKTRTAECRQMSTTPLPRKQMVTKDGRPRGQEKPGSTPGFVSNVPCENAGAGNGTRTRDPLLGKQSAAFPKTRHPKECTR